MSKTKIKSRELLIGSNKRLDTLIERILEYHGKTREAVAEYCKAAIEEGFTGAEAWSYLYGRLRDRVARSTLYDWGNKYLPEGSMKVTAPKSSTKKTPEVESSENERSLPKQQLERLDKEGGRVGYINEEHECYKDVQLNTAKEQIERLKEKSRKVIGNTEGVEAELKAVKADLESTKKSATQITDQAAKPYTVYATVEYAKTLNKRAFAKEAGLAIFKEGLVIMQNVDAKFANMVVRLPVTVRVNPAQKSIAIEIDTKRLDAQKSKTEVDTGL